VIFEVILSLCFVVLMLMCVVNRWEEVARFCGRSVEDVLSAVKGGNMQRSAEDKSDFDAFLQTRKAVDVSKLNSLVAF
jgi:hypothetical protein